MEEVDHLCAGRSQPFLTNFGWFPEIKLTRAVGKFSSAVTQNVHLIQGQHVQCNLFVSKHFGHYWQLQINPLLDAVVRNSGASKYRALGTDTGCYSGLSSLQKKCQILGSKRRDCTLRVLLSVASAA
jgi:hypothetical protein